MKNLSIFALGLALATSVAFAEGEPTTTTTTTTNPAAPVKGHKHHKGDMATKNPHQMKKDHHKKKKVETPAS